MPSEIAKIRAKANAGIAILENYDEIKASLDEKLDEYRSIIVTPNTVSEARSARATVNKVAKLISDSRISIKKQLLEQYESDFRPKMDELEGMCKEVADRIGAQINEIKEAEKAAHTAETEPEFPVSVVFRAIGVPSKLIEMRDWCRKNGVEIEPYSV